MPNNTIKITYVQVFICYFIYHLSIQKGCPMQDFYRMKQPLWVLFSIRSKTHLLPSSINGGLQQFSGIA